MRAAFYRESGPAKEVILFGGFEDPRPGPGEVRVRLQASGVNPSDVKSRTVMFERVRHLIPVIPNTDGAGIVDSVGEGVDTVAPGDRVWVAAAQWRGSNGTCAEYVVLPKSLVFPLPENTSVAEGACAGVPLLTAMHAVSLGPSIENSTVLVSGGATSVGHYVIQLAKQQGARVLTTVGDGSKAAIAREAGADETIVYKTEDVVARVGEMTDGAGVDYLVDMDMSYYSRIYPGIVARGGFIVVYGSNAPTVDDVPTHGFFSRDLTLKGFLLWNVEDGPMSAMGRAASAMLRDGKLKHNIGATYPFEQTADAHDAVEHGRVSGNVVIEI